MVGVLLLEVGEVGRHRLESHREQSRERERHARVRLEQRGRRHRSPRRPTARSRRRRRSPATPSSSDISPTHAPGFRHGRDRHARPSRCATRPRRARTAPVPVRRRQSVSRPLRRYERDVRARVRAAPRRQCRARPRFDLARAREFVASESICRHADRSRQPRGSGNASSGNSPCCIANRLALARFEVPIDREEVFEADDAFYMPPGAHRGASDNLAASRLESPGAPVDPESPNALRTSRRDASVPRSRWTRSAPEACSADVQRTRVASTQAPVPGRRIATTRPARCRGA